MDDTRPVNRAVAKVKLGKLAMTSRIEVSTAGLIAIGGMVTGILLSTAALVWVTTAVPRARPTLAALRRR